MTGTPGGRGVCVTALGAWSCPPWPLAPQSPRQRADWARGWQGLGWVQSDVLGSFICEKRLLSTYCVSGTVNEIAPRKPAVGWGRQTHELAPGLSGCPAGHSPREGLMQPESQEPPKEPHPSRGCREPQLLVSRGPPRLGDRARPVWSPGLSPPGAGQTSGQISRPHSPAVTWTSLPAPRCKGWALPWARSQVHSRGRGRAANTNQATKWTKEIARGRRANEAGGREAGRQATPSPGGGGAWGGLSEQGAVQLRAFGVASLWQGRNGGGRAKTGGWWSVQGEVVAWVRGRPWD